MTECLHLQFHIKYQERITKEERGGDILKQTQNNVISGLLTEARTRALKQEHSAGAKIPLLDLNNFLFSTR